MIRLAEAHAKMRLSEEVTADDVEEAVRLIKAALKQAATDARTGLIDMGLLTEGGSASERRRRDDLKRALLGILDEILRNGQQGAVRVGELLKKVNDGESGGQAESNELLEALRSLELEGQVQLGGGGDGARRTVRRITGVA